MKTAILLIAACFSLEALDPAEVREKCAREKMRRIEAAEKDAKEAEAAAKAAAVKRAKAPNPQKLKLKPEVERLKKAADNARQRVASLKADPLVVPLMPRPMKEGSWGALGAFDYASIEIFQIIGPDAMLIRIRTSRPGRADGKGGTVGGENSVSDPVMVKIATKEFVEGAGVESIPGCFRVTGKYSYVSGLGGTRTVQALESFDVEKLVGEKKE